MEQNLNFERKNNENENYVNELQKILEDETENNHNLLINKEQLSDNDINNFSEILIKIKKDLEEKNELKIKNKENKRNSKKIENINQTKNDNININAIVECLKELIVILSKNCINEENEKYLNINDLLNILKKLQLYSIPEIIKKIEIICYLVINNIKDKEQKQIFIEIMINMLNYNEKNYSNNTNIIIISLKLINDLLMKYSFLIEPVYDITIPKIYNILNLSKINEEIIQMICYKILLLFICDNVFSFNLVKTGLLTKIKQELYKIKIRKKNNVNKSEMNNLNENKEIINEKKNNVNEVSFDDLIKQIYILLINLLNVDSNLIKLSEELMEILLSEFIDDNYIEEENINIKVDFFELLMEKEQKCVDIFINYKGLECILKILIIYERNKTIITKIFHIINIILTYNKTYNEKMYKLKIHEQIKKIIDNLGKEEKDIDFSGKSLKFLIEAGKTKLVEIEEYDINDIKSNKGDSLPAYIKNFLNNGKIVKIVNDIGEIKKKYLYFTPDFLKIIAKKVNSPANPKSKYIIDTMYLNSIVKGYGTDAFKKSKRLFRAQPEPNLCFSIIAFHPEEGQKTINIICEKESEVDKWINYMKKVIVYLQETNRIKKNVEFYTA